MHSQAAALSAGPCRTFGLALLRLPLCPRLPLMCAPLRLGCNRPSQIKLPGTEIKLGGSVAYLVWKSVYITKQASACAACVEHGAAFTHPPAGHESHGGRVGGPAPRPEPHTPRAPPRLLSSQVSFRNRVLILFDWLKAQMFGRDLSNF